MNKYPNIHPEQNYKNLRDQRVFTGRQILNLLEIADARNPVLSAILLLEIEPTKEAATQPHSKYGTDK